VYGGAPATPGKITVILSAVLEVETGEEKAVPGKWSGKSGLLPGKIIKKKSNFRQKVAPLDNVN